MIKKSIYFFLIALTGSIVFAGLASLFFSYRPLLVLLYSFGVTVAVLAFKWKLEFKKNSYALSWIILACFFPVIYISLVYLSGWKFFGYQLESSSFAFLSSVPFVVVAAFFEEIGWRGFLFNTLRKIGWIKMNLLIGVLWAFWHFPAIFTEKGTVAMSIIIFTTNVILLSFIFGWFRQKTDGIIAPTLIHAFHNITYSFWAGKNDIQILSESGIILTLIFMILIVFLQAWKEPAPAKT